MEEEVKKKEEEETMMTAVTTIYPYDYLYWIYWKSSDIPRPQRAETLILSPSPPALSPHKGHYRNPCSKITASWSDRHGFLQNECQISTCCISKMHLSFVLKSSSFALSFRVQDHQSSTLDDLIGPIHHSVVDDIILSCQKKLLKARE